MLNILSINSFWFQCPREEHIYKSSWFFWVSPNCIYFHEPESVPLGWLSSCVHLVDAYLLYHFPLLWPILPYCCDSTGCVCVCVPLQVRFLSLPSLKALMHFFPPKLSLNGILYFLSGACFFPRDSFNQNHIYIIIYIICNYIYVYIFSTP